MPDSTETSAERRQRIAVQLDEPFDDRARTGARAAQDAQSEAECSNEVEALGAIRLALEAGADCEARERLVAEILRHAPEPEAGDTRSVKLLIEAIRASRTASVLTNHCRGEATNSEPEAP